MQTGKITLSIDSRYENVQLVGCAVHKLSDMTPLNDNDAHQVELCVSEAVVNSIKHGYHNQAGHFVDVIVTLHKDKLVIEVVDSGDRMDPDVLKKYSSISIDFDPQDIDSIPCSGRGLAIIQEFMDSVHYSEHGQRKYLTMTKRFQPRQEVSGNGNQH